MISTTTIYVVAAICFLVWWYCGFINPAKTFMRYLRGAIQFNSALQRTPRKKKNDWRNYQPWEK